MEIGIGTEKGQGIGAGTAIVIIFVVGLLFVSVFIDIVTCPHCGGSGVNPQAETIWDIRCSTCGGDGKITVLGYIYYWLSITDTRVSEGVENGGG